MIIKFSVFDIQSIRSAINQLQTVKQSIMPRMIRTFLIRSCEKVKELANKRVAYADIGENVKKEIQTGWEEIEVLGNSAILRNTAEKAVYVEFGVGTKAKENPHPNQSVASYQYDVDSKYKLNDRSWIFKIDDESNLDISLNNVLSRRENTIRTQGQVGYMFLFNAIEDFRTNNFAKQIWDNVKKEYLG